MHVASAATLSQPSFNFEDVIHGLIELFVDYHIFCSESRALTLDFMHFDLTSQRPLKCVRTRFIVVFLQVSMIIDKRKAATSCVISNYSHRKHTNLDLNKLEIRGQIAT